MKRKATLFLGIYLATCIAISGVLFINPKITYDYRRATRIDYTGDVREYKWHVNVETTKEHLLNDKYVYDMKENITYKPFYYFVLFTLVTFISLFSIIRFRNQ
jgi:hypothetical protein